MERERKVGKHTLLYSFLFLMPFVMGGYLVWCSALAACFLLGLLCCGEGHIGKDKKCLITPDCVMVAMVCLPVMFLLASFWGVDAGRAWFGFVKFIPLPLFLAALRQVSGKEQEKLWEAVPLGGIVMTVMSVIPWCVEAMREWVGVNGRLAGFFQYPNTYAVYLLCGLVVRMEKISEWRCQDIAGCLVLVAGILLSGSRTALVIAIMTMGILILHNRREKNNRAVFFAAVGGSVLFLIILTVTGNIAVLGRYLILPAQSSTFLGRLLYAKDALPVILHNPFGLGYMGYYFLQGSFQTGVYATRHVHNELLQLLLDIGWLPVGLISYAVWKAFKQLGYYKRLLLTILLVHSLFDFDLQFLSMGCIWVLLMANGGENRELVSGRDGNGIRLGRKSIALFLKRIAAMLLAVFCLWIGAADFLAYAKHPEIVVRFCPAHTESWMELLTRAETPEEMGRIADRILRYNHSVALAYDAKALVSYAEGDAQEMVRYKLQAIGLARYEMEEYEDYFERLFTFYWLYLEAGMTDSAAFCRERILEIPAMLKQVEENSSPLAWRIYEKPQLELTEEMQRGIAMLEESWH